MPGKEVENKEEVDLREGNISLILESYNDLFSGFDPRPYSERALSNDFIDECKRAARDREHTTELRILVPKEKRNINDEFKIKKRLKAHFSKHFHEKEKEIRGIKKEGVMWFAAGAVIMVASTFLYILTQKDYSGILYFLTELLFVLSQPAGWFMFWEGLGKIFIASREYKPEYEFYKKMIFAEITFNGY